MASITIRNLEEELKSALRVQAARHGRSMEEEARDILRRAVQRPMGERNLATSIRARFQGLGGVELGEVPRGAARALPSPE
jgi:antitoxin FitA